MPVCIVSVLGLVRQPSDVRGERVNQRENVRTNMVDGAVRLLATQGVEGTSFSEVLAAADAPRGSVYHHFPGGKSELMHAALDRASERSLAAMEAFRGQSAPEVLEHFLELWRGLLEYSHLNAGCAVLAVTVTGPESDLHDHVGSIFKAWTDLLTELFVAGRLRVDAAHRMATLTIAATEGAIVLARAQRSTDPFDEVAATLMDLVQGI
jgi:TetR/AcrR family transcriptional repressor of lmrAB and yxaGH operons